MTSMLASILQNNKWLIGIAVIELVLLGVLVYGAVTIHQQQQELAKTQNTLESTLDSLSETQKQLIKGQERLTTTQSNLQADVGTFADKLSTSREQLQSLKTETQEQLKAAQQVASAEATEEIKEVKTSLQDTINEQIAESNQKVSSIVDTWAPRIAKVRCGYADEDMHEMNLGSATLFKIEGQTVLLTNRHVLEEGEEKEERCFVDFPESDKDPVEFTEEQLHIGEEEFDFGYIAVEQPTDYMNEQLTKDLDWCTSSPEVGASMVVIGYPKIGADNSITATEGIISGYDDSFYISSAKVDKGNSGGVAVLVEENCYLGIPTKTYKGVAEALARILDAREIEL